MPTENDNIELRSEKVRNIIGAIPPYIVRTGTSVFSIIVLSLLVGSYFFYFPETIQGKINLLLHDSSSLDYFVQVNLPYKFIMKVQRQQKAIIEIEGYNKNNFGLLNGEITSIKNKPITINGKNYFEVTIKLNNGMTTTQHKTFSYYPNLKGNAKIIVGEHNLLEALTSPLFEVLRRNYHLQ